MANKSYGTTEIQLKPRKPSQVTDCGCEDRQTDNMIDEIPCCGKLHDKFWFKLLVFLLVLGLDTADLISDWLLYHDVSQTEEGLVYGPVNDATKYSLLAFSIIGSLTFTFEVINLWLEIFRRNPWIDSDLLSAIIVWIEDVPQIVINVIIVACREDAISYFQLVKASVIILGCVIRVIVSLIKYCGKKARHDLECASLNKESCRHVTYRVFIMIGLLITLGGAIAVFLFTQSERNPDGSLNFKVPHTIVKGEWDDSKYFKNVSIFFSHPIFDQNHRGALPESQVNWIRLVSINNIRQSGADRDKTLQITYENITATRIKMKISEDGSTLDDCFEFDRQLKTLTASTCNTFSSTSSAFVFQFHYKRPQQPVLIFGDISYNIKIKSNINHTCTDLDTQILDNIDDRVADTEHNAIVHYFQTKESISDQYHVIHSQSKLDFFHLKDLTDISEVWKVGFASCKSSGSMAPHRDTSIAVSCP